MELKTAIEILNYHQEWRLGKREDMIHTPKKLTEALNIVLSEVKKLPIHNVSEMFDFAGYLYGNFDYHDNTKDGDIYIHNDNNLKYTREKIYQQWLGTRNSL